MTEKHDRNKILLSLLKAMGIICFITAAVLIAVIVIMHIDSVKIKYSQYLGALDELEYKVTSLDNKWLILIVIMLLYLLRSLSPFYPLPIVWIMSSMVFSPLHSFIINLVGMMMINAFRYYTGVKMGEGYWNGVIKKHSQLNAIFNTEAKYNSIVLLAVRIVPVFPYNTMSHLYGSFDYPFVRYMLISAAALIPRLISYSFIGNNVYDPLSSSFYVPLTALMVITGVSFFILRFALKTTFRIMGNFEKNERTDENG